MPPKSTSGKGKGSKGPSNEIYYEEMKLSDEIVMLNLRLSALKSAFVDRMEKTAEKQKEKLLVQSSVSNIEKALVEKKAERVDILADFTRQYKTDEREAILKITELDSLVNKGLEQKIGLQREIDEMEKDFDMKIKKMKQQFEVLCQREEDMEKEFQAILGDVEDSAKMLASQQVFENNPAKDIHLTTSPKCDTYEGSGVGGESHLVRKWTGTVIAPERSFLRDVNESPLRSGSTIDPSIYSLILKCEELHSALLQESRLAQSNSHFCLILSTLDFLTAKHMDRLERELHLLCGCLADATLVSKSLDFYRQLNSLSRDLDQVEVAIAVDEWISMIDDRMSALNCTSQGVVSLPQDPKAFFQAAVGVSHVLDEIDALQKNMERSLALIDENVNYLIRINSAIQK